MRSVYELSRRELNELKEIMFCAEDIDEEILGGISSPGEIPDSAVFDHYNGILFERNDFFCNPNILFIDGKRSGYSPEQCGETMTVGDLRKALNEATEHGTLTDEMPIYLCNDNGYTYGEISSWSSFRKGFDIESSEDIDMRDFFGY